MAYRVRTRDEHLRADGRPKRILALDGGGLRGILSIAILARLEEVLRERHGGGDEFRLCHYFDLIAGTSTGAIIAAALAQGWSTARLREEYFALGRKVFEKSWLRDGAIRAKYDQAALSAELKRVYGEHATLGGPELQTGLLVVTKRLDSGSPWPVGNNPRGAYFAGNPATGRIGNADYPLWQVVRASTAAPSYFDPESITIASSQGTAVTGNFVDGGMSPFNNPALQAVMYATLDGYRVGWPTGADRLLLVSVGTGAADPRVARASVAGKHAVLALLSLMQDCATLQQALLQWMSSSPTARTIDREMGDLGHDLVAGVPLMSYLRYDVDLQADSVKALNPDVPDAKIAGLSEMDAPENMEVLHDLGARAGRRDVAGAHFASRYDLPAA
jgi:hypothetical protein